MDEHYVTAMLVMLIIICCCSTSPSSAVQASCDFPAIFSFGTSLSDSAQSVSLPFLPPYLSATKSSPPPDFSHGVNYAVAGATVQGSGYLLLQGDITFLTFDSLGVQLNWHLSIKQAAQAEPMTSPPAFPGVTLPSPNTFSKALYFIEFGGNDYGTAFLSRHLLPPQSHSPIDNSYILRVVVPNVVNHLSDTIELLYANEARNFFIPNLFPEGCAPLFLKLLNGTKDEYGCLKAFNELVRIQEFFKIPLSLVFQKVYSHVAEPGQVFHINLL